MSEPHTVSGGMPPSLNIILAGIFALFALRLVLAVGVPLVDDEAYYALWARGLSAGYYDHPPAIAWSIAFGVGLLGESPIGVRLGSVLSGTICLCVLARTCWIVSHCAVTSALAVLWLSLTLMFAVTGSTVATPDSLSILFWAVSLWALIELHYSNNPRWWLVVGLAVGLGVLAKLTNLLFVLGLVLWLSVTKDGRKWWKCPQAWLGGVLALVIASPYLAWNIANDGLGLERQLSRVTHADEGFHVLQLIINQAILVSPVIAAIAAYGFVVLRREPVWRITVCTSLPLVGLMIWHAMSHPVQDNWLAPLYFGYALIAALAASRLSKRWISRTATTVGAILLVSASVIVLSPIAASLGGRSVINQGRGWSEVQAEVARYARVHGASWYTGANYGLISRLALESPGTPVWQVSEGYRYGFRGVFPDSLCSKAAIFVMRADDNLDVGSLFAEARAIGRVTRRGFGQDIGTLSLWRVRTPLQGYLARMCAASPNQSRSQEQPS